MTHGLNPTGATGIRALFLEGVHPSANELFREAGCEVEALPGALSEEALIEQIKGVHVLGIRSKTHVSASVLAAADSLIALGCFCIGTNQVNLDAAAMHGVPVFNAPFSNTRSVAELIIAEVVMLARQVGDRSREVHQGVWTKSAAGCFEVRGKTLGIVGYGHIGAQVGVLAEALGMRVLFFDVMSKLPMGNNHARGSLDELLEQSDFVTLHVPATPQTRNMIGAAKLARMRRGAYLLNASRGTVVDIPALADALRSGHLAGAAIDVFPKEPETNQEPFTSELQGIPNVILTPHVGGSTSEAQASIGREVATSLMKYLEQGATTGAVNFPAVELAPSRGTRRVLNVHRNVPGVMKEINRIVSDTGANIHAQILSTDPSIGYLIMDIERDVSESVREGMANLPTSIRTRIVY